MPHFQTQEVPVTQFGVRAQEQMDLLGLDINALAGKVGSTYEYMRKIVRGMTLPSKYMVRSVAQALKIDPVEAEDMIAADRMRLKLGESALRVQGIPPDMEQIVQAWGDLTPQSKKHAIDLVQTLRKQDRKHRREAANNG